MAGWFNKLKNGVSSAIQKIKNLLPLNLGKSEKIENILKPLSDFHILPEEQEIFKDAPKHIKTKAEIKKAKNRKN